jgi:hypothetical protein
MRSSRAAPFRQHKDLRPLIPDHLLLLPPGDRPPFPDRHAIAVVRIAGLAIEGPGPFPFKALPPEILIVVLSTSAFFLKRRGREALTDGTIRADATADTRLERR